MKRFDPVLLKIFLCGLPVVAVLALFNSSFGFINGFTGLVIAVWMALAIILSLRLIISPSFREQALVKVTFIRERDEREALMTGRAARATFLTSLAILILLFCLSCFQVSFYRMPPEYAVDGKTGVVSLGVSLDFLENAGRGIADTPNVKKEDIFTYDGLPVSSSGVILSLMVWQIVFYNYTMRRLLK
jgi:hypothetical protein